MTELSQRDILYEDNHLIVCNKRAGILVQGDYTGDVPLIDLMREFLKKKYKKPGNVYVGMVHRLDRPTSGCVLFTKTSKALPRMQKIFAERKIKKVYWALAKQGYIPESGELEHFIQKSEVKNVVSCSNSETRNSKKAALSYEILARYDRTIFLELELKTGRKHQIRAQLSKIGVPIVGDLKYGYPLPNKDKSICLHCRQLAFIHPVKLETVRITATLPKIPEWSIVK